MGRGIVSVLLLAVVASGCGEANSGAAGPGVPAASPTAALAADRPVTVTATVLDSGDGPELCLGGVADSLPPQCSGPPITGWDWDDHPEADSANDVRWGEFVLVGGWDGTTFSATESRPAGADDWAQADAGGPSTPCEEPEGGWAVVDQSINPRWEDYEDGDWSLEVQQAMNDPAYTVLNVGVTDDLAGAEAAVREVWGGPLCVSRVANTFARLREVAVELQDLPGGLGAQFGSISNRVELPVVHDDGSIQAWVDEEYGQDVVVVTSVLEPAEQ